MTGYDTEVMSLPFMSYVSGTLRDMTVVRGKPPEEQHYSTLTFTGPPCPHHHSQGKTIHVSLGGI